MKYLVKISAALLLVASVSFAQNKVCQEKEADAKKLFEKCKALGKGHPEYESCKNSFNVLSSKFLQHAKTVCQKLI